MDERRFNASVFRDHFFPAGRDETSSPSLYGFDKRRPPDRERLRHGERRFQYDDAFFAGLGSVCIDNAGEEGNPFFACASSHDVLLLRAHMAHVRDRQTSAAEDGYGHTGEAKTHTVFLILCFASLSAETGKGGRGRLVERVERLRERGWAVDAQGARDAVECDAHDEIEPHDIGVHLVCELLDGVLDIDVAALEW